METDHSFSHEIELQKWDGRAKFSRDRGDEFFQAVRTRVTEYLEKNGKTRFDDGTIALKGLLFGGAAVFFYSLVLSDSYPLWALQLFAIGFGVSSLLLSINVAHDAAHQALTPYRWLNNTIQTICFTILGANAYLWQLRHVKSHHVFPNVNGCDIDIDDTNFLRLSPNQERRQHHRYQHFYAPFIFWLVDLHTVLYQDFVYLFRKRLANMLDIRHPPHQYIVFILSKCAYIAVIFVIPTIMLDHPWWVVLLGAFITTCTISVLFVVLLIGTHFCEETMFPRVGADGRIGHSWATHALITSLDWSPSSRLANFIAGGANAHAAHHLFPIVAHIHYIPITKIIREAAEEFGIPYQQTTLPKMIASHFRFLRRMGRGDEALSRTNAVQPQAA